MFKHGRAAVVAIVALGATWASAGPALAKACPNHTTTTVSGSPSYTYVRGCILSWDSTPIVYNLFEPLHPAAGSLYTILEGPGWGGAGDTTPDSNLIKDGYAEMTWDPRGFGESGGVAEVDSPASEGRDVSALITKVLTGRPEIAVDTLGKDGQPKYTNDFSHHNTKGQPVVGMTGFSYGGGIEWSTAAFDRRVKAMAPGGSWNDLDYAEAQGAAAGYWDRTSLAWFHQRSYAEYGLNGHAVDIPTLAYQGSVDTLFTLNDAWNSLVETRAQHASLPLKLIAFCGGHVSCPTGAPPTGQNYSDTASKTNALAPGESAGTYTENATIAWFNHYLRGEKGSAGALDKLVPADDNLVYQDQTGNWHALSTFPTPSEPGPATYVTAPFTGTLVGHTAPTGASNAPAGEDTAITDGATPAGDPGQVTVPVVTAKSGDLPIVGIGHVTADVTVDGPATNLFFRLIDENTGDVVDLQTAPLRLDNLDLVDNGTSPNLPPAAVPISLDLAGVSYLLPKGDTLELQVSTSTNSFVPNRGAAVVSIANGKVSVPTL